VSKQTLYFGTDRVSDLVQAGNGVPGRLHFADIDADGYPDLLVTGKITRDGKDITQSIIFMNSAPQAPENGAKQNGITSQSRREFEE
jgi:hypothetical protein